MAVAQKTPTVFKPARIVTDVDTMYAHNEAFSEIYKHKLLATNATEKAKSSQINALHVKEMA